MSQPLSTIVDCDRHNRVTRYLREIGSPRRIMMRTLLVASAFAFSSALTALPAAPAQAGALNCWYEEVYGPDMDIDGDGVVDPNSGPVIGYTAHCEPVVSDELNPDPNP